MTKKSEEQVDAEILELLRLRSLVKPFGAHKEDQRRAIDAQVETLQKRLGVSAVYLCWGEDENGADYEDNVFMAALAAADWLNTYFSDGFNPAPSERWKEGLKS